MATGATLADFEKAALEYEEAHNQADIARSAYCQAVAFHNRMNGRDEKDFSHHREGDLPEEVVWAHTKACRRRNVAEWRMKFLASENGGRPIMLMQEPDGVKTTKEGE
jgi:hypothetical protein